MPQLGRIVDYIDQLREFAAATAPAAEEAAARQRDDTPGDTLADRGVPAQRPGGPRHLPGRAAGQGRPRGRTMPELWRLSAEAIAAAVRAGELQAPAVVESCLDRTARVEPADRRLPAAASPTRRGERAAEIDRRRDAGERLGALAGVPVALKDNLVARPAAA